MRYKAGLETQQRIVEATGTLIARKGLDGTTIKAICDEAGVLPGSFYNLFESKEAAILSVVRQSIDAIDPDPDHQGAESLAELVEAYITFLDEQSDLARVYIRLALTGVGNDEVQGRVVRHHQGRVARFAAAISREHPELSDQESERRAETLVSALNGIALSRVTNPDFDVAIHARALLTDAMAGVG